MSTALLISIVDDDDTFRLSIDHLIRSAGLGVQGLASPEAFCKPFLSVAYALIKRNRHGDENTHVAL